MRYYTFEGYKLSLRETDKRDSYGHVRVAYTFKTPDNEILFQGDDFGSSPLHDPESKASAIGLLAFLTLKPGDTDADYFDKYTPRQMEFAQSMDAENLSSIVYDYEERQARH